MFSGERSFVTKLNKMYAKLIFYISYEPSCLQVHLYDLVKQIHFVCVSSAREFVRIHVRRS